jgi:hypothetical protein
MSSKVSTTEYEHFLCAKDGGKFVPVVGELAADFEFAVDHRFTPHTRISLDFDIQTLANFAGRRG